MKLDEGEGIVDVQICTEKRRRAAHRGGRPVHPLRGAGGARVHRPHLDGRARHHLEEGDKLISLSILRHVEATADERAAYLKRASAVRRGEEGEEGARRCRGSRQRRDRARRAALCRDVGGRAVRADGLGERLGQAHVVLRVPHHRPRRQRHRRDVDHAEDRPAGRLVPGRGHRPDHAGDRRRPAHPLAGRRHPHRGPLDAGRDRVRHRRRRARGLGRAAHRRGRGERRRYRVAGCQDDPRCRSNSISSSSSPPRC